MFFLLAVPHLFISQDLWGDDAEEFNPDRWIDPERIAQQNKNPFMFLPFNAGPRIVRPAQHLKATC